MWHEIGHYFDEARYHGGRGQVNALYTTGKYSSPNKEILQKHTDYINKDRIVPEIAISVRYKGERFKDLNDLIKAKDVDSAFKEKIKYIVAKREAKLQDYLKQRIELFADGFANYVVFRIKVNIRLKLPKQNFPLIKPKPVSQIYIDLKKKKLIYQNPAVLS
jgi:hypothetical protein